MHIYFNVCGSIIFKINRRIKHLSLTYHMTSLASFNTARMTLTDVLEFKISLFFQTFLPERIKHFNVMRKIWRHTHIYMIISRNIDLTLDTRNFEPQMLILSYSLKEMVGMHYLLIKLYFTLHSNSIHQFLHTFRKDAE